MLPATSWKARAHPLQFPDLIQPFKAFGLEKRKDELYWEGLAQCYEQGLAANVGVCNCASELSPSRSRELRSWVVPPRLGTLFF